jgi:multiple sugar transport system permease protein
VFFAPYVLGVAVIGLLWRFLLDANLGFVNHLLGTETPWVTATPWAWVSLVGVTVWWTCGFNAVIYLAGLQDIPAELYEAATVDGASAWQRFRHVTLPNISPVVTFTAVIGVITTLQYFAQAAVAASAASGQATTGAGISSTFGYPEGSTFTYPLWLYVVGFRYGALGYANAMAVVLFLVAFAVSLLLLRRSLKVT